MREIFKNEVERNIYEGNLREISRKLRMRKILRNKDGRNTTKGGLEKY